MNQSGQSFLSSTSHKTSKLYTLIVVKKDDQVLLGYKKRGFGVGTWNGFGGKVEEGESIRNGALRELQEECGLVAKNLFQHGILWFRMSTDDILHEVHLFSTDEFEGCVTESEEMKPKWFDVEDLPFEQMWPSNRYWLPLAINETKFDAFFLYKDEKELIKWEIHKF